MTPAYRPKGLSSYEYALARNEAELASFQESPTFNDTELSKYYMGDLWQKGYGFEEIRNNSNERYNLGVFFARHQRLVRSVKDTR